MKNIIGFESCLKKKLNSYMELRESQGYQTSKVRYIFSSLDKYLQEAGFNSQSLPADIIDGWIASLPKELNENTVNIYISTYIQFAKYLQSSGCSAFIPEKTIGNKNYSPYIFHEDELLALIQAADDMVISVSEKYRHNAACFSVMLRMYIGCGFRLNEIRLLKTKDVDLEYGIIHVRNAKGNRDRLVPMHESLTEIVKIYLKSGIPQKENWFFPSETGQPIRTRIFIKWRNLIKGCSRRCRNEADLIYKAACGILQCIFAVEQKMLKKYDCLIRRWFSDFISVF